MFKREGIELSVIKTEGLNQNPNDLGCDIYINDDFIDTISPLNSTQDELITDIPLSGSLGLVIKNSLTSAKISSVSLALDLFQNSGHFWLPLFKD